MGLPHFPDFPTPSLVFDEIWFDLKCFTDYDLY